MIRFSLVKAANDLNINVRTRPGASSVIAALELSGSLYSIFISWVSTEGLLRLKT